MGVDLTQLVHDTVERLGATGASFLQLLQLLQGSAGNKEVWAHIGKCWVKVAQGACWQDGPRCAGK